MTIYNADLLPLHPVSFLWALPAVPAAGAVVLALAGRFIERRFGRRAVNGVAVAATGAAAGIALASVFGVLLAVPPGGRVLLDSRGALIDVAGVQVPAALTLDLVGAVLALVVALAGVVSVVVPAVAPSDSDRVRDGVGTSRAVMAAVAGGLLAVLADNPVLALVGWEGLVLAGLALAASREAEAPEAARRAALGLVVTRAGQTVWLAGVVLLLWGLATPGGARAVLVDARGVPGAGIELNTLGDRPPGASLRQVPVGPTLVSRDVAQQLDLRDTSERRPFEAALLARRVGTLPLVPLVCLALLLGAAALGVGLLVARPGAFAVVTVLAAGAAIVARSWALFALSPAGQGGAVAVGLAAVGLGLYALVVGRSPLSVFIVREVRELGVVPAIDFARAADWLERRVLGWVARVITGVAVVVGVVLLFS